MSLVKWASGRVFNMVHRRNLVYNTCWEDPRLDHVALQLGPEDRVMVITSAGCNALDYALAGPQAVHAVDMNPRQNALLELKCAGIRQLDHETFFQLFGRGRLPNAREIYQRQLRGELSDFARAYWDRRIKFFTNKRNRPFYFRGTSGTFAKMMGVYIDRIVKLRPEIEQALNAETLEEQREIYASKLRDRIWTRPLRFAMRRDATLSLLGVPRAQRVHLESHYEGGIVTFVEDCLEAVFNRLPLKDNYFWRVYITGEYTPDCCPEYLKPESFARLKSGLVDRVQTHTNSVQGFLETHPGTISRFVLLDHMDWLHDKYYAALEAEWQAIIDRAAPAARVIWRSGGMHTEFVDGVQVQANGRECRVGDLLTYNHELADELHDKDRVHTYGSFRIADITA